MCFRPRNLAITQVASNSRFLPDCYPFSPQFAGRRSVPVPQFARQESRRRLDLLTFPRPEQV